MSSSKSANADISDMPNDIVDVMKVLPKDAMKIDVPFAFFTLFRVWVLFVFSTYLVYVSPWYFLPITWIFMGTCATGLFVVGHECAHQSFTRSRLVNEIVGTICMMPLLFPYNAWELTHNHHHATANNLEKDHLWRPLRKESLAKMSAFRKWLVYYLYGPLFFESSVAHHAWHFVLPFVTSKRRLDILRSIFFAILGGIITVALASYFKGIFVLYIVPFLIFQFWLSTFTYFHHRNPRGVGWKEDTDWTRLYGSLFATVHVDYPAWIEYLTLDINWHLPHHVSPSIPWYNLRKCTYALLVAYGDRLQRDQFGWKLWRETTTSCHVFDKERGYAPMYKTNTKNNKMNTN